MSVERPRVLISGASVAGPVLAYWLHRFGFRPTVIERVADLRVGGGGHAVDLFGPIVELMDWMGALPEVEQARTQTEVTALIRPGSPPGRSARRDAQRGSFKAEHRDHALRPRQDPLRSQQRAGGIRLRRLDRHGARRRGQVEVTFERGGGRTFDLLVGADGLHSITCRLVFGPEESFLRFWAATWRCLRCPTISTLRTVWSASPSQGARPQVYPVGDRSQARVVFAVAHTPTARLRPARPGCTAAATPQPVRRSRLGGAAPATELDGPGPTSTPSARW